MQYPPNFHESAPSAPRYDGTQACAGADLELFFPTRRGLAAAESIRVAKALCATCSFLAPCLRYAVTAQGSSGVFVAGVWGGTTQAERTRMRLNLSRSAVAA